MGLKSEKLRDLPLEDGREAIRDLLSGGDDVSMVVEKHGNILRGATMQRSGGDTERILVEAREERPRGYSREEAFADIEAVQAELRRL